MLSNQALTALFFSLRGNTLCGFSIKQFIVDKINYRNAAYNSKINTAL